MIIYLAAYFAMQATPAAPTAPVATPQPKSAATPPPCATVTHRAFDFWVGDWDVTPTGAAQLVAHSKIERLYDGCAIRENWMPLKGSGGGSLSAFDTSDGRWHQRWIDNSGTTVNFDGGMAGSAMVMTGLWRNLIGPGQHGLVRMRYTANADGSVRQLGEQSIDHGISWQPSFDFTYRRAKPR